MMICKTLLLVIKDISPVLVSVLDIRFITHQISPSCPGNVIYAIFIALSTLFRENNDIK